MPGLRFAQASAFVAALEAVAVGQDRAFFRNGDLPGHAIGLHHRIPDHHRRQAFGNGDKALQRLAALQHLQDIGLAEMRWQPIFACLDPFPAAKDTSQQAEIAGRFDRAGLFELLRRAGEAGARRDLDRDIALERSRAAPLLDEDETARDRREHQQQSEATELAQGLRAPSSPGMRWCRRSRTSCSTRRVPPACGQRAGPDRFLRYPPRDCQD